MIEDILEGAIELCVILFSISIGIILLAPPILIAILLIRAIIWSLT